MLSFEEFSNSNSLDEALIIVGKKAYPKFGHVVIMAGGAGSGKGFILNKLLGLEGMVFDPDALKKLAAKSKIVADKVKKMRGVDINDLSNNLKNPENVSLLHDIIGGDLGLDDKKKSAAFASIIAAPKDKKPNLVFDTTLSSLDKLQKISADAVRVGYDRKNIHIVWVVNDIEIAKQQNQKRSRVVPTEILVNTHRGAAMTMHDILNMGGSLSKYMDGDIVFAFNKVFVDSSTSAKEPAGKSVISTKTDSGGFYVGKANYFYVKRTGKTVMSVDNLEKSVKMKIKNYVPKNVEW